MNFIGRIILLIKFIIYALKNKYLGKSGIFKQPFNKKL